MAGAAKSGAAKTGTAKTGTAKRAAKTTRATNKAVAEDEKQG
jgi:hypothetical protein